MKARTHWLITGRSQSGKTTLARRLLSRTPRWIALDPEADYDDLPGVTRVDTFGGDAPGGTFVEEVRRLADPDAQVRLSLVADRPEDHLAAASAVYEIHRRLDLPPTVLVLEEAWKLAQGQRLPRPLARIYFAGLKHGLVGLTVTQALTQVPKGIRRQTEARIYLRLVSDLPGDAAGRMQERDLERLGELQVLERNGPEARRDRGADDPGHYVTDPPDLDLEAAWRATVQP